MTTNITFHTYSEALLEAKAAPGAQLIGLYFPPPYNHLGVYIIDEDADEPGQVNVSYEGGELFSEMGEEDFYEAEDAPEEAKGIYYAPLNQLGDGQAHVLGMTSEFVLQSVIPGLNPNDKYRSHSHFMEVAGEKFELFWKK